MKCLYPNMIVEGKFKTFNQKVLEQNPDSFLIPCNQCFSCKLNKSREWAAKCIFEAKQHKYNYFITLTYEDSNLQFMNNNLVELTGELRTEPTLVKKDLQNFIKRLRKKHYSDYGKWNTLKYLACGEYGEVTKRPHYHLILFSDYPIPDLVQLKRNFNNDMLYTSSYLDKIWKMGFTTIGEFSPATASYVARYTIKKLYGKQKKELISNGYYTKEPEFLLCSKNPALGYSYFEQNKETYSITDTIAFYNNEKLVLSKLPNSWVNKLEPNVQNRIKKNRTKSSIRNYQNYLKLNNNNDYKDLLKREEIIVLDNINKLMKKSI